MRGSKILFKKLLFALIGIKLLLVPAKAATLVSACRSGANTCSKRDVTFFRYKPIDGEVNVTYDIAYFQGENPIANQGNLGSIENADELAREALDKLSNVKGSAVNLKLGERLEIKTIEEGLKALVGKSKNKRSVIIIDNSPGSQLVKAFFKHAKPETLGVGGVRSIENGEISSSYLLMNGSPFINNGNREKALAVAMHELLHSLGIGHTQVDNGHFGKDSEPRQNKNLPLMYPRYLGQKPVLRADDESAIRLLYPNTKAENGTIADETMGVIRLKLLSNNRPVTGYMAIAYDAKDPSIAVGAPTGFKVSDGVAIIPIPIENKEAKDIVLRITPIGPSFVGGNIITRTEKPNTVLETAGYFNGETLIDNDIFADKAVSLVNPANHIRVKAGLNDQVATKITLDLANFN